MEKKVFRPKPHEGLTTFRPPLCYELTGRTFELIMDGGTDYTLTFNDRKVLTFTRSTGESSTYPYDCLKAAEDVYFVNFEAADEGHVGRTFVLDLQTMLVTAARAWMGFNNKLPRMVDINYDFGAIPREDGSLNPLRHGYTRDIVGKSIKWYYGLFEIVHVYSSERYYRVDFSPERLERLRRENSNIPPASADDKPRPVYEDAAAFIKIRDNLYLVGLLELVLCRRNGHGNSLLVLMDLDTMHDVGRSFGTNNELGDENYTLGAIGTFYDSKVMNMPTTMYIR